MTGTSSFLQEALVELADLTAVASLRLTRDRASRNSSPKGDTRLNRRRICQCGSCHACLENAKWNRIFSEKFEDPDYHKPRLVWGASSLASFHER